MKFIKTVWMGSLILFVAVSVQAKETRAKCNSGSLSVDNQCVPIGNRITFYFQTVHSVKRSQIRNKSTAENQRIEISGRGNAGSFGGSLQNSIPLTVTLNLKEGNSEKADRIFSLLQSCHQGALLSLSSKEKYIFSLDLESERSIATGVVEGGDGNFEIQYDLKSESSEGLLVQCGNSLKAQ